MTNQGNYGTQRAIDDRLAGSYMPDHLAVGGAQTSAGSRDPEMDRICALPIAPKLPPEFYDQLNDTFVLPDAKKRGFRLHDEQAEAVYNYWNLGGGFDQVGCGWGKTIIGFLCAHVAYQFRGLKKGLLMVPPKLATKTRRDLIDARSKVRISVPLVHLPGLNRKERLRLAQSNRAGLYVFPYSFLQIKDTMDLLRGIDPDYLIMDEAHKIKNVDASSVKRLLSWLRERYEQGRPVEIVAMSGTMTSKRVADYHHTISFALREGSPLPVQGSRIASWDQVLDVNSDAKGEVGPLAPLVQWARHNFPEESIPESRSGFRKAYQLRLTTTPGVVSTGDREVGATLYVEPYDVACPQKGEDPAFDVLTGLRDKVVNAWLTPNGDEIDHGFHLFKWEYELASGFYNQLRWPSAQEVMGRYNVTESEAFDRLKKAAHWLECQNKWHKAFREWREANYIPGLDTPLTVAQFMEQNGYLPDDNTYFEVYKKWTEYHAAEFEGRPERISEPIRVSDFKVRQICDWVQSLPAGEGSIVWCYHNALREWIVEELNRRGVANVVNGASQDKSVEELILNRHGRANACHFVLQLRGYMEGHNMQYLEHMMYAQMPRQAEAGEQSVARIHRVGYEGDEFTAQFARGMLHDTLVFQACLNDALYVEETTSIRQRLVRAEYPVDLGFVSDDVLRARIHDMKDLTPEARERFAFLFGDHQQKNRQAS